MAQFTLPANSKITNGIDHKNKEVSKLPKDSRVEIEAIGFINE